MSAMKDLYTAAQEYGIQVGERPLEDVRADVEDAEWAYEMADYYGLDTNGTWREVYEAAHVRTLQEPDPDEVYERMRDDEPWGP